AAGGVRLAGVIVAEATADCRVLGMSVRASAVSRFIHGVIDQPAPDAGQDAIVTDGATADAIDAPPRRRTPDPSAPADAGPKDAGADAATDARDAAASHDASTSSDAAVDRGRVAPASDAGCGCSTGGRPARGRAEGWLVAVAIAVAARRRRRRPSPDP